MEHLEFLFDASPKLEGETTWQAPSNIALVKYWGKHGVQLPKNPSVSFTLSTACTTTTVTFQPKANEDKVSFELLFEGQAAPAFHPKLAAFFERITPYVPFLKHHQLHITTSNSFPHSSGIASSASAMAALALNIMSMEQMAHPELSETAMLRKASFLARLGSGSAVRSITGPMVVWGEHDAYPGSSSLFGVPFEAVHPVFQSYQDTILLVDKGQKKVSSTLGHNLMHQHPYATQRFKQADDHMGALASILGEGEVEAFCTLVEAEALALHAMMLTSHPSFILMRPNTLAIIEAVLEFRRTTKIPLCYTLDAGANVHLLYPESEKDSVHQFITHSLQAFCHEGEYIHDAVGTGAKKM